MENCFAPSQKMKRIGLFFVVYCLITAEIMCFIHLFFSYKLRMSTVRARNLVGRSYCVRANVLKTRYKTLITRLSLTLFTSLAESR